MQEGEPHTYDKMEPKKQDTKEQGVSSLTQGFKADAFALHSVY